MQFTIDNDSLGEKGVDIDGQDVNVGNVAGRDIYNFQPTSQIWLVVIIALIIVLAIFAITVIIIWAKSAPDGTIKSTEQIVAAKLAQQPSPTVSVTATEGTIPAPTRNPSPTSLPSPTLTVQPSNTPTVVPTNISSSSLIYKSIFDFPNDMSGWQGILPIQLVSGYKGNGIQIKSGQVDSSYQLPQVYRQGKKFNLYIWCNSTSNDKCKISISSTSGVGINDSVEWEVQGNQVWQRYQTPILKLQVDSVLTITMYAPVKPNGIVTYDEVELYEVP